MPYHELYFTDETERQRKELGIEKLSEWFREKIREAYESSSPLSSKLEEIHRLEEQLARRRADVEKIALERDRALQLFEDLARRARSIVAHRGSKETEASVQTTLLNFVHNHPAAQRIRDLLPKDFKEEKLVDVLLRWPDSRAEVQVLVEAGS